MGHRLVLLLGAMLLHGMGLAWSSWSWHQLLDHGTSSFCHAAVLHGGGGGSMAGWYSWLWDFRFGFLFGMTQFCGFLFGHPGILWLPL